MDTNLLINLAYIVSAILFVDGLKNLGHPSTARKGNLRSAIGMLIAVSVTLLDQSIVSFNYILIGFAIGTVIGVLAARLVAMTQMPEMVALFNGFGGMASLLVGWATLEGSSLAPFTMFTIFLSILIGGVTFSGSLVAYGKLSEKIPGRPIQFASQKLVNLGILATLAICGILFVGVLPGQGRHDRFQCSASGILRRFEDDCIVKVAASIAVIDCGLFQFLGQFFALRS